MNAKNNFCLLCLTASALSLVTGDAFAVNKTPAIKPPADSSPHRSQQATKAFELPPVEVAPPSANDANGPRSVWVQRVTFSGNTVVETRALDAIAAPYLNRNCDMDEIEDLRQKLTRYYVDKGFVNSGLVWNAQTVDGVLAFTVREGRLTDIRLTGMKGLDPRYVTRRLAANPDEPLNMDTLRERFQLLLADPLFQSMNARLVPGERTGDAALEIDVQRARVHQFTVFANNYRPPSIGETGLGLNATLHNLSGFGDVLDASLQGSPDSGAAGRVSATWQLPLGFAGTRFSLTLDHGRSSVVEQPAAVLDISSQLRSVDVGISHPLMETLHKKLTLGVNRVSRENRTWLLGEPYSFTPHEPDGVTREDLWRFWQEYSYRTTTQVFAVRSTLTWGQNNLQEIVGVPDVNKPSGAFRLWMGQMQWARKLLDNGAQFVVRGTVQRSPDGLLSLDGLSVGGVNTVRGYRENQLVRDQGEYINLEFDYPWTRNTGTAMTLNLIPFVDYGRAQNRNGPDATLASAGLAARIACNGLVADLVVSRRLRQVDAVAGKESALQDKGIHLQMSYKF